MVQWDNDPACLCGSMSSIPGVAQWVKDLELLCCGTGHSSSSDLISGLGTSVCHRGSQKRGKRNSPSV